MVDLLYREANINIWTTYGPKYLFGTWIKKETYLVHNYVVPATGKVMDTPVVRRRVRTGTFNWNNWGAKERAEFVAAKMWGKEAGLPPMDDLVEGGEGVEGKREKVR